MEINIHSVMTDISKQEKTEIFYVYGKLYKKLKLKYPDLEYEADKKKLACIREQGYFDKFIDLIKETYPDVIDESIKRNTTIEFTDEQKIKIFEPEINLIGGMVITNDVNDDIKKFVMRCLLKLPDYFFSIPASSTGKYHPEFSCEQSGLVKHTKAAIRIALTLFDTELFEFNERVRGLAIASILLHDGAKLGFNGSKYTVDKHPLLVCDVINETELKDMPKEDVEKMCNAISTHMGKWNTSRKSDKEILPKPKGRLETFVHICDLISSRKYVTFDFNEDFKGIV